MTEQLPETRFLEEVLLHHESGGLEGDGSDYAVKQARAEQLRKELRAQIDILGWDANDVKTLSGDSFCAIIGAALVTTGVALVALPAGLIVGGMDALSGGLAGKLAGKAALITGALSTDAAMGSTAPFAAEIHDLREGLEIVEEKARAELGMVKANEIFVQIAK